MLGDGIRRNIATVSKEERDRYIAAVLTLDTNAAPWVYSDGISFFDKQQWVHYAGHASGAHAGQPAGMSWHREAVNRYEGMLRAADPELSLHYWDWTSDPRNQIDADGNAWSMFDGGFIGDDGSAGIWTPGQEGAANNPGPGGEVGPPFANFETTFGVVPGGIVDTPPHQLIWRDVNAGPPVVSTDHANLADVLAENAVPSDSDLLAFAGAGLAANQQFNGGPTGTIPSHAFVKIAFGAHNYIHHYIGGTFDIEHIAARDPIFWLIHSNLDRLWAMWQRMAGEQWRLDPNQVYGLWTNDASMTQTLLPWNGSGGPLLANQPLVPWVIGSTADNNSLDPGHAVSAKNCKDPTIVIPHSYDTAPHSSYIIMNRDTFSSTEVGVTTTYQSAFFVVYDGFEPQEITANPTIAITNAANGAVLGTISAINPVKSLEDPGGAADVPQRITIAYDIHFTGTGDFPPGSGDTLTARVRATLSYDVDTGTGGATVNLQEVADTFLLLVNQPNPYMIDVEGGNPSWLSVDTRVFQVPTGGVVGGQTQGNADTDSNAPYTFIQGVVTNFNSLPNNGSHPFLSLSADENASVLQLSRSVGGQRVFNYAVAKVRYVAPAGVPATNVQVFFRAFSTMVSALDYDHTSGPSGNYRRSGTAASSIPLLGIQNGEIASIPFFATPRIDTSAASMTTQTDAPNTRTLTGGGATEQVAYFGCWLDINLAPGDPHGPQFPTNPPGGALDGPYPAAGRQTIQTLIRGFHQCLVAEIFFQPAGTDPIPHGATPGSSDRLAPRNLAIVESGNPGGPETHTVQHTFLVKPSSFPAPPPEVEVMVAAAPRARGNKAAGGEAFAAAGHRIVGPDELMIRWNNIPRDTVATFFLPEVDADEILGLAALRQRPPVLDKVDDHTISCRVADISYIPLPGGRTGFLAGLMSLTLPPGVRSGQIYRLDVQQYSGITRKILGAFQVTIPVATEFELLPKEIRKLSVLRHIQQSIPVGNRWYPIFVRYLDQIASRVRGFGGDPNAVPPSPDGGEGPEPVHPPKPVEVCPPNLWCLPIPWDQCEIEGEIDVRIRFRRKCD